MLYYTILYYTILYYTILYYTILYYTILHYTILSYTILYYTILYYTILYYTILYYTVLYYTILYYTILYYTILYYTMLYYTTGADWPVVLLGRVNKMKATYGRRRNVYIKELILKLWIYQKYTTFLLSLLTDLHFLDFLGRFGETFLGQKL